MTRTPSRRRVLALVGTTLGVGVAGCQSTSESTPTAAPATETEAPPETPQATPAAEADTETPAPEPDPTTFAEAYRDTIPGAGYDSLEDADEYIPLLAERQGMSRALERATEMLEGRVDPGARLTFKAAVHNDLGYTQDQVRILERRMSDGSPYAAVMIKDDAGNWIKDLMAFTGSERGYLRHDEDSIDSSRERGIRDLWREEVGVSSATAFENIRDYILSFGNREESDPDNWKKAARGYGEHNDHIVVGEDTDVGEVCYTQPAAKAVANIQDFDDHQVFNREMELVENVTQFYHNQLGDGYTRLDVTADGLGEGQVALTHLDGGRTLYAEEVGEETYTEAVLSLYEAE